MVEDDSPEWSAEDFDRAEVWDGNRYLGHGRDFKNGRRVVAAPRPRNPRAFPRRRPRLANPTQRHFAAVAQTPTIAMLIDSRRQKRPASELLKRITARK